MASAFEDFKKTTTHNLLSETGLIIYELKESSNWEKSHNLTGTIMFAMDADWHDLEFQFTLHATEDYFLHISPVM